MLSLVAAAIVLVPASRAGAQDDEPPTEPNAPLVIVPAGCVAPAPARAVFVGTLVDSVPNTARFSVDQVRAGSLDGFAVGGQVDVDYDDETRFLDIGETYLVGVGIDPVTDRLSSKVREPAPLFGGNDVIGVDDTDVLCPEIGDPIRTVFPDGSSVETGVFSPLAENRSEVVRALALPAVVAFAILLGLAALKAAIAGIGRGYGVLARRALGVPSPARPGRVGQRRHTG